MERRKSPRRACEGPLLVRHGGAAIRGWMRDLTNNGAGFVSDEELEPGIRMRLEFRRPDGERVEVEASLVRALTLQRRPKKQFGYGATLTGPMRAVETTDAPVAPQWEGGRRQRIREVRALVELIPVELSPGSGIRWKGSLEEVSASGVRIASDRPLRAGTRCRVQILPPEGSPCPRVGFLGVIRWVGDGPTGYLLGVSIEELPSSRASEWADYVVARLGLG